LLIKADFD